MKIKSRTASFLIILLIYIAAAAAGFLVYYLTSGMHLLVSTLLADIAATIVVWLCGIFLKNSSVYDPYWSVAPIFIIIFWIFALDISITAVDILLIIAIFAWGIRLTTNWALRWKGMVDQDWRYIMFRKRSPKMWFLTNLFGINLMPTLIVYIALTPLYHVLGSTNRPAYYATLGFIVCIFAVAIQAVSDRQMDIFKKNPSNKGKPIDCGLWKYSRHPNYLGEISFWWGIWLMQIWINPSVWWTVAGPILMTMLFVFISIPMMERHIIESRPEYREYQKNVSVLKFLPRKNS
jgi:steroid 5-alpha reductase family enzyme